MLGFLSPSGKFYECAHFGYIKLADELLNKYFKAHTYNPVDLLCAKGRVVIQRSFIGFSVQDLKKAPRLTTEQKEWLIANEQKITGRQRSRLALCLEINNILYEQ